MKQIKTIFILSIALAITISACKKGDTGLPGQQDLFYPEISPAMFLCMTSTEHGFSAT
jgi:hypothetical protein